MVPLQLQDLLKRLDTHLGRHLADLRQCLAIQRIHARVLRPGARYARRHQDNHKEKWVSHIRDLPGRRQVNAKEYLAGLRLLVRVDLKGLQNGPACVHNMQPAWSCSPSPTGRGGWGVRVSPFAVVHIIALTPPVFGFYRPLKALSDGAGGKGHAADVN